MTTIAITALPVATAAATTDVLPIVQLGTTKQLTNALLFTSPTLVTPALGTPASGNLVNCTGTAAGLTAGNVTTNANLTGAVTSVGNVTSLGSFTSAQLLAALTNETGTGSAVFATSPTLTTPTLNTPTLVTPVLGAATGTSLSLSGFSAVAAAAPTIASAATIAPITPIVFISGTAAVVTITAAAPIATGGGTITLIPTGAFTWTAAGNIAVLGTAVVSRALTMTYDVATAKWYPSYV